MTKIAPITPLQLQVGYDEAARLLAHARYERAARDAGVLDPDSPSRALFEAERSLLRSEFTPEERARIRAALGIDLVAELIPELRQETR
jgi:hypothetical protein